jgi:hypothetical protein
MTYLGDDDNDDEEDDDNDDDDNDAAAQAARARRIGTNIVRSHLQTHLDNNPDSSFMTWIATLHPENASVTIDERFFIPGNPWQTVYQEAITMAERPQRPQPPHRQTMQSDEARPEQPAHQAQKVRPVEDANNDDSSSSSIYAASPAAAPPPTPASSAGHSSDSFCGPRTVELLRHCSPVDLLIGTILGLTLIATVVGLEVTALFVYCCAALFYHLLTTFLSPPGWLTGWLYALAGLLYLVFALVDAILLLLSVAIGEFLAALQFALSFCFGGCHFAATWHQAFRRTTHWIRVRFRAPWQNPKRHGFGHIIVVDWWQKNCRHSRPAEQQQQQQQQQHQQPHQPLPTQQLHHQEYVALEESSQSSDNDDGNYYYNYSNGNIDDDDDDDVVVAERLQREPTTAMQTATVYRT